MKNDGGGVEGGQRMHCCNLFRSKSRSMAGSAPAGHRIEIDPLNSNLRGLLGRFTADAATSGES